LLVVNENSRLGNKGGSAAVELLERNGIELLRKTCSGPDQLAACIRQSAGAVQMVVLGGGDGTLNSAAPVLAESGLPLGILPMGTANDLARTLEIPSDLVSAAQIIVDGHLRKIDLGDVNGKPFFNVASLGLSTQMTRELTSDVKQRWGAFGYALATFRALSRVRPFSAEIRSHNGVRKVLTLQISVGNGRHYGGGMTVEENAEIDDGCLNLYSLEFDRVWKLALVYPAFRSGRHGLWKEVRTLRCNEVEVRTRRPRPINTDGEITTQTPARFTISPRAISVFSPSPAFPKLEKNVDKALS
jgi:YegS/Rv2252/BmrU family lipid kinase